MQTKSFIRVDGLSTCRLCLLAFHWWLADSIAEKWPSMAASNFDNYEKVASLWRTPFG